MMQKSVLSEDTFVATKQIALFTRALHRKRLNVVQRRHGQPWYCMAEEQLQP